MKFFGNKKKEDEKGDKNTEDWIFEGDDYYKKNKFDMAVKSFTEALNQDPDNVYAWGEKGKSNYKLKNYQQSLEDLNHALELDPEYVVGYYLRAFPLAQLKKYPEAVENFKIFQKNAGPEFERELEITQKNLETLLKHGVNQFEDYKKLFPVKNTFDITSSDLEVEGRLKDRIVKIYGQKEGLRFCDVDFLDKIKENLFYIDYGQINSIEFEKSILSGKILLNAEGTSFIINCFSARDGRSFVDRVQERIKQSKPSMITEKSTPIEGYHRKTRSDVEIMILDEGISLKYTDDASEGPGQVFNYGDIESVDFSEGLINVQEGVLKGELTIKLKDKSEIEINKVTNTDGRYIEDVVHEKIFKFNSITREKLKSISSQQETPPETDPLDEIEKAKKLLDMGAITEKQFEEIRDRCLKKLS